MRLDKKSRGWIVIGSKRARVLRTSIRRQPSSRNEADRRSRLRVAAPVSHAAMSASARSEPPGISDPGNNASTRLGGLD